MCAVSYLNTVPLVWGMLHGPQATLFDLSFCVPSECADRLENGQADIGIVPAVEVPRLELEVALGAGIACRGPVRSILLISKTPVEAIRTLAADVSSRTSVALTRVILARRYGIEPRFLPMPPDLGAMLDAADAALIIGDPALRIDPSDLPFTVLDLGQEWTDMTGLPMVFAVWAGNGHILSEPVRRAFVGSCRFGLERIDEIVETESQSRGMDPALVRRYLSEHIAFELGEKDYEGLRLFLQYAGQTEGLIFARDYSA